MTYGIQGATIEETSMISDGFPPEGGIMQQFSVTHSANLVLVKSLSHPSVNLTHTTNLGPRTK